MFTPRPRLEISSLAGRISNTFTNPAAVRRQSSYPVHRPFRKRDEPVNVDLEPPPEEEGEKNTSPIAREGETSNLVSDEQVDAQFKIKSADLRKQLELTSISHIFRRLLIGAQHPLRPRAINDRMRNAQTQQDGERHGRPWNMAVHKEVGTLQEWFARQNPESETRRLRLLKNDEDDQETQTLNAEEHASMDNTGMPESDIEADPKSFQDQEQEQFISTAEGNDTLNESRMSARETEPEHAYRDDATLAADTLRFQIRACRSPEDILTVMIAAFRPVRNPDHPAYFHTSSPLLSNNVEPTFNSNDAAGDIPIYICPLAQVFAQPSTQRTIAAILQRINAERRLEIYDQSKILLDEWKGREEAERAMYHPDAALRILACLAAIRQRFRKHIPSIPLELPIIDVACRSAARTGNLEALNMWLGNLGRASKTEGVTSAERMRINAAVCKLLHQHIRLRESPFSMQQNEAIRTLASNHLTNQIVKSLSSFTQATTKERSLPADLLVGLNALVRLLHEVGKREHIVGHWRIFYAFWRALEFHGQTIQNLHDPDYQAFYQIPATLLDALFVHCSPSKAWTAFRAIGFSKLWWQQGKDHEMRTGARARFFRVVLDQIEAGKRLPQMKLNSAEKKLFERGMAEALEVRLEEAEKALGVRWDNGQHQWRAWRRRELDILGMERFRTMMGEGEALETVTSSVL